MIYMKPGCCTCFLGGPYDEVMLNPSFDLVQWPYPELVKPLEQNIRNLLENVRTRNGISLVRLEGITIVPNLIETLKMFDAGYPSDHAAAMRDTVMGRMITTLRGGRVQGHIFLPVDVAFQIALENAPARQSCEYILVHEIAHVQDLEMRARALSNSEILAPPLARPIALCLQVLWNEYAASRLSGFIHPSQLADYHALLRQSTATLLSFRKDLRSTWVPTQEGRATALAAALNLALPILQAFAYLVGHCRGIDAQFTDNAPENFIAMMAASSIWDAFSALEEQLDSLWTRRNAWTGFSEFEQLANLNCDLIRLLTGVVMVPQANRGLVVGFWDGAFAH
jgi:hypothetical protein